MQYVTLSAANGLRMPVLGLGTWRASAEEVSVAVNSALQCGYRHIDTAFVYNNEEAIGDCLKKWLDEEKVKRDELFITTKLPVFGNRAQDVERFLKLSLERLKLTYVDLYLMHMPFAFACDEGTLQPSKNDDGTVKLDTTNDNLETWKVMEEQVKNGLTKAIGLSNFNADQVRTICNQAEIKPSVLQVEMHAYLQQNDLLKACSEMDVAVTAYSPLGSPGADKHFQEKYNYNIAEYPDLLGDPVIAETAIKYEKTPGQILLKHLLQRGVIVIPKSGNPSRIQQNFELFDFKIDEGDMEKLDALDKGEGGRIFDFLFFAGVEKHPQYPFPLKE